MSEADRNALIDAYFDSMDTEDLEIVRSALADDFVYGRSRPSASGSFEGPPVFRDDETPKASRTT